VGKTTSSTKVVLTNEARDALLRFKKGKAGGVIPPGYSSIILSACSELESHQDALDYESVRLESQKKEFELELENLKANLTQSAKVSSNLLELFIISVGGTPPGQQK
jgi:hypothetical protein